MAAPRLLRTSISLVVYSPLQKHSDVDENAMLILLVYDADYIIKQDWKRCESQDSIHSRWHWAGFLWFSLFSCLFTGPSAWEWTMLCTDCPILVENIPWTTRIATATCWPPWTLSHFLIPSKRVDIQTYIQVHFDSTVSPTTEGHFRIHFLW
jgi:hypothetical protein